MIRACAFDLGNTLVDDTALYDRAVEQMAHLLEERRVIDSRDRFAAIYDRINRATSLPFISHTFGELQFFRAAFDELGVTSLTAEEALCAYREIVIAQTSLRPAIRDGLVWLGEQSIQRAILSNERSGRVDGWLSATATRELFEIVFVSESVGVEKPHESFFSGALERIGVSAEEVLMFGDNTIADGACRNLGIRFVHVTVFATERWYFERGEVHEPDYVLSEISRASLKRCLSDLEPGQSFAEISGGASYGNT
ncbi:MAG: HAD family hydrolase [Spirochaetia bacterium]